MMEIDYNVIDIEDAGGNLLEQEKLFRENARPRCGAKLVNLEYNDIDIEDAGEDLLEQEKFFQYDELDEDTLEKRKQRKSNQARN